MASGAERMERPAGGCSVTASASKCNRSPTRANMRDCSVKRREFASVTSLAATLQALGRRAWRRRGRPASLLVASRPVPAGQAVAADAQEDVDCSATAIPLAPFNIGMSRRLTTRWYRQQRARRRGRGRLHDGQEFRRRRAGRPHCLPALRRRRKLESAGLGERRRHVPNVRRRHAPWLVLPRCKIRGPSSSTLTATAAILRIAHRSTAC